MNRFLVFLVAISLCLPLFAETTGQLGGMDSDGDYYWIVDDDGVLTGLDGGAALKLTGVTVTGSGVISSDMIANVENTIEFTPAQLTLAGTELTASTAPGLESHNSSTAIVWSDGETTPSQVTFKIPSDYASGGAFRAFCDSDAVTTPSQVDFNVYLNKDNQAWDGSATNQTPVALARGAGTPETVTLSVTTDFSALAAGDVVTFQSWRDDTATGTDNLELYFLEFFYSATQ